MAFIEVSGPKFQAIEGPTVLTRRNFGLTRGKSLQEAAQILQTLGNDVLPNEEQSDFDNNGSGKRRNSVQFGLGGLGDKSSNVWDWPLGEVNVVNTDTTFEAIINFKPYTSKEISAMVMGTELIVHCKSNDNKKCDRTREFIRSYQLPLNLDPTSVRFFVSRDDGRLLITGDKVLPIKLAIAFFTPDYFEENKCGAENKQI